jgi:3-deoxy-D-manno-octulosonic-acid transferase
LGNSKFDQEIHTLSEAEARQLRQTLRLPPDSPVFVAGSTRSAEEEAEVITAYKLLLGEFKNLCLIIAPRQIDRSGELLTRMQSAGLNPVLRTGVEASAELVKHLILDTMGELANVYAVATFAFVGNSFDPVVKGGGQNLLQPLAHGKAVLFGPRIATIRSEVDLVRESGVGFQVSNGVELAEKAAALLRDPALVSRIHADAIALIRANRGVSARYADAVIGAFGIASRGSASSHEEE